MLPLEPTQIFVFQPCLIFLLLLVGDQQEIIKGLRNLMKKPFILETALPRKKKKKRLQSKTPNTEGGNPTTWCAHSYSFVSTLGI